MFLRNSILYHSCFIHMLSLLFDVFPIDVKHSAKKNILNATTINLLYSM